MVLKLYFAGSYILSEMQFEFRCDVMKLTRVNGNIRKNINCNLSSLNDIFNLFKLITFVDF